MTAGELVFMFAVTLCGLLPPVAVAVAGSVLHDIRWRRECATANARYADKQRRYQAEAAWQAKRAAAIAAVEKRNDAVARRGGNSMLFEGIPEEYQECRNCAAWQPCPCRDPWADGRHLGDTRPAAYLNADDSNVVIVERVNHKQLTGGTHHG